MDGFSIYGRPKLKVFLYIYREKTLYIGQNVNYFNIWNIYFIDFSPKGKKICDNTEKNPLGFGSVVSNFHSMQNNEKMRGIYIFFGSSWVYRGILLVGSIWPIEDISNRSPKAAKLQKFFFGFHRCSKLANWTIFGQKWRFLRFFRDLWPLDHDECPIMMNSNCPHGYPVATPL